MSTIATMAVKLQMDSRDFEGSIGRVQQQAESLSKKLANLGQGMTLGLTAPLVGIAAAAVNSASGFEQSMNVMGQVTGATADQMEQMQAQALELGAVTSFSAGEAAEAMLELGKAGLKPEQIMDAIGGTMDLAAAGNLDLAQAATIASNAMNAFQLPASEVTDIANMLAAAANASSADVTDLAAGMQMAGAVFASNGQSINDLAAGMAILANNGIAGSDAGTSLKTMLMRLAAPTDEAAGVMNDLGIQVFNADGSMRSFADMVGSLETATKGLTDQEKSMALTTIFGADAIRAATILAENGADGFSDMQKAVTKEGSAAATAGARMKGFGGAMEYLKGSIDSFLINAALPFLDSLSGMVRWVADLITMVGELPAPMRNTAIAVGAVLAAAGPVLLIVSKLIPVFSMLGTVLGAIASPMGLVVIAVTALVTALATDFMGVRTALTGMVDSLLDMAGIDLNGIIDGVKAFGFYIGAVLEDGDELNDWLTHLPEAIQPVAQAFGKLVATITSDASIGEKIQAIQADLGALWTSITELDWGGAWAAFQTWLNDWATAVADSVQTIDWGGIATTTGEMFGNLANWVVTKIQSIPWGQILGTAVNVFGMLGAWVVVKLRQIDWGGIFQSASNLFGTVGAWVIFKLRQIDWGGLFGAAGNIFTRLSGWVITKIKTIDWGGAFSTAGGVFTTLSNWIIYKLKTIDWSTFFGNAGDLFWQLKDNVISTIKAIPWGDAISAVTDFAGGIATPVLEAIRDHDWAGTLATIAGFADGLATAVGTEISKAKTTPQDDGKLKATDIDAAIIAADAEFSKKMSDMVDGWAETIKTTDFTKATTSWLDKISTSFDKADWSTLGTELAGQINDLFKPDANLEGESAISFGNLETAIIDGIKEMNWTKVKDSLSEIDTTFADGLGEFAGAFSGTFVKPQWLTDLLAWSWPQLPETPIEWLNTLLSWVWPTLPDPPVAWLMTLLDWLWPELPGNPVQWLTTLLDWDWPKFPAMPDWIGRLLGWAWPTAPSAPNPGTPAQINQGGAPNSLPVPNNQNFDGYDMDGSAMGLGMAGAGAPLVGPVYVTNQVDVNALAYQVAQLLGRRR